MLIVIIAVIDAITPPLPLGYLYLFPILLMAGFLPRPWIALLVVICAALTGIFSRYELRPAIILFVMALLGFQARECSSPKSSEIASRRCGTFRRWRRRSDFDTNRKVS
jgi:hypothetical protein